MPTSFFTLPLPPELLAALDQLEYTELTPIQDAALPLILEGIDLVGQAKTGSGKTAAFGLGLLARIDPQRRDVQALVLCPTRELSDQVAAELRRLAQRLASTRVLAICGGRPMRDQQATLAQGAQVVVGTPGRIGDHLERGSLSLEHLVVLVLDEADRMLDMGFIDQVQDIIAACPTDRQTLLFSATLPPQIIDLSSRIQHQPQTVRVSSRVQAKQLAQQVHRCERQDRRDLLVQLLAQHQPEQALVFCETRSDCDGLVSFLQRRGAAALALHGGLEQRERDDVLVQFANGSARVLVATDVAARGLHVDALPVVIITELSPEPANHIHRIGRTGRAGEPGLALSIVAGPVEEDRLARTEAYLGERLEAGPTPTAGHSLTFLAATTRTLLILSGRKDKLRKGDVLGALVKDGGIPSQAIGRIVLTDRTCAVAVSAAFADDALAYLHSGRVKNKRVRAVLL